MSEVWEDFYELCFQEFDIALGMEFDWLFRYSVVWIIDLRDMISLIPGLDGKEIMGERLMEFN